MSTLPLLPALALALFFLRSFVFNDRVPAAQQLLFPDPQPLVERLGRDFFRQLPATPGVYLMRDARDAILYVGKAKNLRKRLGAYRVANPDRMPRRHLRLVRAVARIELQECADELSALAREAELLRLVRPKFNRAGTWSAPPRFFAWRCFEEQLHLAIAEAPDSDWRLHGPLGARAIVLRAALARLIWVAVHPRPGFVGLPAGWFHGTPDTTIHCGPMLKPVVANLEKLLSGQTKEFCDWIRAQLSSDLHSFEKASLDADLEVLTDAIPLAHANRSADNPPDRDGLLNPRVRIRGAEQVGPPGQSGAIAPLAGREGYGRVGGLRNP